MTLLVQRGGIHLKDCYYKQFAESLLSLAPGFPMDAAGIEKHIKNKGFDSFISITGSYDPGISEIVELMILHGGGGEAYGKR